MYIYIIYKYIYIYICLVHHQGSKGMNGSLANFAPDVPTFSDGRWWTSGTPIWVWYMKMMGSFGLEIITDNHPKWPGEVSFVWKGIKPTSSYPNWEVCCRCHELITGAAPWWKRGKIIPTKPCWSDVKCAAHWPNLGFSRLIASFLATN